MPNTRNVAFVLLLLASTLPPSVSIADELSRHVLIIGVDGTRYDALQKAKTPNIDRMIADGGVSEDCQILGERHQKNETISGPGWSSILTGVWADKHGVHDNDFKGKNYDEYPHVFARIPIPEKGNSTISLDSWKPLHDHLIGPAKNIRLSKSIELPDRTPVQFDLQMEDLATEQIANSGPLAMFVYFHQIDTTGHAHGFHPEVPQYIEAIENVDRHVGELTKAVETRRKIKNENWLVIICTDHGGRGLNHSGGHDVTEIRQTFLILWQPGQKFGRKLPASEIVDVAPTALAHLQVPIDPAWKLDGKPLSLAP
jgi:predicted AlkP superfamily pyrophosphatase or phosphodiesterase